MATLKFPARSDDTPGLCLLGRVPANGISVIADCSWPTERLLRTLSIVAQYVIGADSPLETRD